MRTIKAAVFVEPGRIVLDEKPVPEGRAMRWSGSPPRPSAAPTSTSSRGEYPVERGRIVGHELVGVIEELGPGVTGYEVG